MQFGRRGRSLKYNYVLVAEEECLCKGQGYHIDVFQFRWEVWLTFAFRKAQDQIFTVFTCGDFVITLHNFLKFLNLYIKTAEFFCGSHACETAHLSWWCSQGTIIFLTRMLIFGVWVPILGYDTGICFLNGTEIIHLFWLVSFCAQTLARKAKFIASGLCFICRN